jgi:hypothetical protein
MWLIALLVLLVVGVSFPDWKEEMRSFFSREGYVVEVLEGKVYLDLGRGSAFRGERFRVVRPGREIVHPVTGEILGTAEETVGSLRVLEVEERYSVAEILEDRGVERGLKVRLVTDSLCFVGSEEGLFKVRSVLGEVREGEDCDYVIREMETGYGVEFKGRAVAFFEREVRVSPTARKAYVPEDFTFRAKFIMSFKGLPLSADLCHLFGKGKEYLAVLFENKVEFYEVLRGEPVKFASMYLPAGYPVSVQCADLEGTGRDLILINMVSDGKASSAIAKVVGETPVVVLEGIPYLMAVLDRSRPSETFVGQEFDREWGQVKKLRLKNGVLSEGESLEMPPGFRVDGALMVGDLTVFIDSDGYLRVYRGQDQVLSEGGFGTSYTSVEMPVTYGEEEGSGYHFYPRPFRVRVLRWDLVGVVRNVTSPVFKFLDVSKFTEGELYLLIPRGNKLPELRKVQGRKLEEAVQAVVVTREGRVLVITGRKGTIPIQNRGDLFEIEINPI